MWNGGEMDALTILRQDGISRCPNYVAFGPSTISTLDFPQFSIFRPTHLRHMNLLILRHRLLSFMALDYN